MRMAALQVRFCHKRGALRNYHLGLTLIEVLIALAIISIALTAIIKAATQNIRSTQYLQNKTIAMWVGNEVLNEARVNLLAWDGGNKLEKDTNMLGQIWYWQASQEATSNTKIKIVKVKVFDKEPDADDVPLADLETYVYDPR